MQPLCRHLALAVLLVAITASAQVATGTPPFGSFGGGPFDIVNLGNLNVHFTIPILHKAGRGLPFAYDLTYDSSVWTPVTSSGTTSWQPDSNWGWGGTSQSGIGYVAMTKQNLSCQVFRNGRWVPENYYIYTTTGYVDRFGILHPAQVVTSSDPNEDCYADVSSGSASATDGSGYTLSVTNYLIYTVTSKSGEVIKPTGLRGIGSTSAGTITDTNGNQITENNSGQFFDTLSSTIPTLTITSPAPPAATTFTYPAPPNGTSNVSYTMNYKQYTVQTNFGVSPIQEYGPRTNSLVSSIVLPDGSSYTFSYEPTTATCTPPHGNQSPCVTGRLQSVTLPTGGIITYSYSGGSALIENDGSAAYLTRTLNGGTWTYNRSFLSGTTWNTLITDPTSNNNETSINSSKATNNNFYETQRIVYQGRHTANNPLLTVLTCYNGFFSNCATATVSGVGQKDVFRTVPTSTGTKTSASETVYGNGAITSDLEYDYGVTAGQQLPVGPSSLRLSATTYLYANVGNSINDHPAQITVSDGQGNTKSQVTFYYDQGTLTGTPVCPATGCTPQHISITGSRGNLTSWSALTTGSSTISGSFTYYDTGNVLKATDTNSGMTTYHYGACGNSFLTETDLPMSGLKSYLTWDANCAGGVVTQSEDVNNNVTNYTYGDPNFWRPTITAYPDGGSTTLTYNEGTDSPWNIVTTSAKDASIDVTSKAILDGFGRAVTLELTSDPTGADEVDATYDVVGRVASVTNPHRSTSSPTDGTTLYTYDPLNRIIAITHPDNSQIGYTYTGAATQVQDEGYNTGGTNKITKIYQADGLGRTTSVCEISSATLQGSSGTPAACNLDQSGTGFLTTYAYDPLGNTTQVVQPGVGTRTFAYDGISRLTQEVNPESGTTNYTYDHTGQQGDLYQRIRPKPNQTGSATATTTYSFDLLHRLTNLTYDDGTPAVGYYYDQASPWGLTVTNTKGRVSQTIADGGLTGSVLSYDSMGRVVKNWQCTPLNCGTGAFSLAFAYDYLGDVTSFNNGAENVTYTYTYDTAARLTKLVSSLSDSNHPATLLTVSSSNYNPLGEITQATLGNGIVRSIGYDNRGRATSVTDGSLYSFTLGYANDSNILTGNDSVNGNWTYTLDPMGRLSTASKTGLAFNYKYDPAGNRWQQNVTTGSGPAPQYNFGTNNQIQGAGSGCSTSTSYCYDSAGNLLNDSFYQYRYDAEGRMTTVGTASSNTNLATYTYDAFGQRVRAIANSQTSDFIFDPVGRALDTWSGTTWQRGEIFAGGMHLGTYNNLVNPATTYFEHTDWVGTARGRSNVAGTSLVETCTSLPFGDSQTCTNTDVSPLHFGELTWDSESNLQHALFRQYSTTEGRWTGQDPAGLSAVDPTSPQSWNRYAYVANNPTTFNDPLGLFRCAEISGGVPWPGCNPNGDIWFGGGGDDGGGGGGGFSFSFEGGSICDSDFMPCGLPTPTLWQSIWSDVLGLPSGLNCPQTGGIFSPLCSGINPAQGVGPITPENTDHNPPWDPLGTLTNLMDQLYHTLVPIENYGACVGSTTEKGAEAGLVIGAAKGGAPGAAAGAGWGALGGLYSSVRWVCRLAPVGGPGDPNDPANSQAGVP